MSDNYKGNLYKLKEKYQSKDISLLIGSGFSKNVYSDFPNWDELLRDMVKELYPDEVSSQEDVDKIIQREGYLQIVTQFEEKKGIREAIEIYIEDRVPFINRNKKLYIPDKDVEKSLSKKDLRIHEKVLAGAWEQIYTTNYDNLLEYAAKKFGMGWKEITNGYDLSFSDTKKNIIKLHGSLRNEEDRFAHTGFGFDGNPNHTYVVSEKDYYQYPEEHEAFAQLMRISLLTGVFCLLGFSGEDPNFLSWITWMRDILQKSKNSDSNSQEEPKIYLITLGSGNISKEMQLFYKNHHICIMPLLNPKIQQELEISGKTPKELIFGLLEYLYDGGKSEKKRYINLWSRAREASKSEKEEMLTLSKQIGFKTNVIKQKDFLRQIILKKGNPTERELELLAIFDTSHSIKYGLSKRITTTEFKNLSISYQSIYTEMEWRDSTLLNKYSENFKSKLNPDFVCFERVVRNLFDLNFNEAKELLNQWNPKKQSIDAVRKAALTSLFNVKKASKILLEFLNESPGVTPKKYYAVELLNASKEYREPSISKTDYENSGTVNWIIEINRQFRGNFSNDKNIRPYGENLIDYRNNHSADTRDVNLLNQLIFLGATIRVKNTILISEKRWYRLCKRLFVYFPYPCFYLSLQFSQSKTLKRIGQDFAYTDEIQAEAKDLLIKSIENIKKDEFPTQQMRNSALILCSELFKSISPKYWETAFMEIWDKNYEKVIDTKHPAPPMLKFLEQGIMYINVDTHKLKIISRCLQKTNSNTDKQMRLLFFLGISEMEISEDLKNEVIKYIEEMKSPMQIGIVTNIYPILDGGMKRRFIEKIEVFLKQNTIPNYLLPPIFYIFEKSNRNMKQLKKNVLDSDQLWANGIDEKSWTAPDFIRFSKISKKTTWSVSEIRKAYSKLRSSLLQVKESKFFQKKDNIGFGVQEQVNLLLEIEAFLKRFDSVLEDEEDYNEILRICQNVLQKFELDVSLEEGLMSSDIVSLPVYLRKLDEKLRKEGIETNILYFQIVVSRFMNKRKDGLNHCLDFLSGSLKSDFVKNGLSKRVEQMLILGINQYSRVDLPDLNLDTYEASRYLVSIAKSLKSKELSSTGIDYWYKIDIEKRFNFNWD